MLNATDEEREEVREYFEWQAPDLEVTFMQKVYSESVLRARHDVWDIHTNKDRWWVITNPTNLYSQDQFPNMDLAVTFHIGLCIRIPRTEQQQVSDTRIIPFGPVFTKLEEVSNAVSQAQNLADYQAVGVRARETLLEFIGAAQDGAIWTDTPPKRADFRAWMELISNAILPGDSNKERRHALKSALESAWTFSNWLTHAKSATWMDAEMASSLVQHALGMATSFVVRELRGVPSECPDCKSPHLKPETGENTAAPGILWERPGCVDCGWAGRPVPIGEMAEGESLITREGEDDDSHEHSIMTVPLRKILKPGDEPIQPVQRPVDATDTDPIQYFAYGSNMSTGRLRARTPSCNPIGIATLSSHTLRFHKRSKDGSGKCNAFRTGNDDDEVIGVIFTINADEREALDSAEGLGAGYEDATVTVVNEQGRRRKVHTYLASAGYIDDSLRPYTWYKDFVVAGAKEHQLPADYVAKYIDAVKAEIDPKPSRKKA